MERFGNLVALLADSIFACPLDFAVSEIWFPGRRLLPAARSSVKFLEARNDQLYGRDSFLEACFVSLGACRPLAFGETRRNDEREGVPTPRARSYMDVAGSKGRPD